MCRRKRRSLHPLLSPALSCSHLLEADHWASPSHALKGGQVAQSGASSPSQSQGRRGTRDRGHREGPRRSGEALWESGGSLIHHPCLHARGKQQTGQEPCLPRQCRPSLRARASLQGPLDETYVSCERHRMEEEGRPGTLPVSWRARVSVATAALLLEIGTGVAPALWSPPRPTPQRPNPASGAGAVSK